MFEKLGDRWEDKFEDLPGFSLVVAIVALVLAAWSPHGGEVTPRETNPLVAVAVAYLLYRSGSLLDKLFDSLYGKLEEPGPRFYGGKALDGARLGAARNLKCPVPGLYNKAASLLRNSEEWKSEVKGKMDGSKAARSLILPLLGILIVQQVRHFHWALPQTLNLEWLRPQIAERFLVGAVVVYLISSIKLVQSICFVIAVVLPLILFIHHPPQLLNTWPLQWPIVGCLLVLSALIYVWRRLAAMMTIYELAAHLHISRHFVPVEGAIGGRGEVKGILFAGKAVVPLRIVALFPCKDQKVSDGELKKAEMLLRSWAPADVQFCKLPERPHNPTPSGEQMLNVSLLAEKEEKKTLNQITRQEPEDWSPKQPTQLDIVIQVLKGSPEHKPLPEQKALLKRLLEG